MDKHVAPLASGRIFLNYRREEAADAAGRLYDTLTPRYPDAVFMDVDTLQPGVDYAATINANIRRSGVLLALIGRQWLEIADQRGARRLDDARDWVRLEIEAAIRAAIPIIPVLLHGATMPRAEDLPSSLVPLTRRHAIELNAGRWRRDVEALLVVLETLFGQPNQSRGSAEPPSAESRRPEPIAPAEVLRDRAQIEPTAQMISYDPASYRSGNQRASPDLPSRTTAGWSAATLSATFGVELNQPKGGVSTESEWNWNARRDWIWDMTFDFVGRSIIVQCMGGLLYIVDAETGLPIHRRTRYAHAPSLAVSGDRCVIALAGEDGVELIDVATGETTATYSFARASEVALSHDGSLLAVATDDLIDVMGIQQGAGVSKIRAPGGAAGLTFSVGDSCVTAIDRDGTMTSTVAESRRIGSARDIGWPWVFSPDGNLVAASKDNAPVKVRTVTDFRTISSISGSSRAMLPERLRPEPEAFSPDFRRLIVRVNLADRLSIYDVRGGREIAKISDSQHACVAVCKGDYIGITDRSGTRVLDWDGVEFAELNRINGCAIAMSPDGRRLALATDDGTIYVYDAA